MDYHNSTNQHSFAACVAQHVLMNASLLVKDLLENGLLSYEEKENGTCVPCHACGGDMDERYNQDKGELYYECPRCGIQWADGIEPDLAVKDIAEWWFVTEWLYKKLRSLDQPVIASKYGYLWGRCTTGQALVLDAVIGHIAAELELLAGQRNDRRKE